MQTEVPELGADAAIHAALRLHAAMMRLDGLPLPPSLLTLLDSCGFVVASDLDELRWYRRERWRPSWARRAG